MNNEWIWVNEGLPSKGEKVVALTSYGDIVYDMTFQGKYYNEEEDSHEWMSDCSLWRGLVVAWQPLPKFPENFDDKVDELRGG